MEVALVILDGWGVGPTDDPAHRNAVANASTPNMDRFSAAGASGTLTVSGRSVGLPNGQMGNSEVGHLNIGAGRIVYQDYTRINDAVAAAELESGTLWSSPDAPPTGDRPFDRNQALDTAFSHASARGSRLHLLGLVSDGGVHSDYRHLFALIELAADRGVEAVTHAFTDGRDTDPHGGRGYIQDVEAIADRYGTGSIATVTGRYFAMDRDERWDRTRRAYDAIVSRNAPYRADTAIAAVESAYDRGESDEFIQPTLIAGGPGISAGDAAIFFNFRADRARQLTRMLVDIRPEAWTATVGRTTPPEIALTTMTEYDSTFPLPAAFESDEPRGTLGAVLADADRTQLRIAESEKYAHVTYFLNGGREEAYPGEQRHIVPSPDVPTYDQTPEMSAPAVTDAAIETIESDDPDVLVLNYANPDMVGHTGDYEATVAAVEAVDAQAGRLIEAVRRAGAGSLITADHGNAEDMGSAEHPHTAHTHNDVPVIYQSADGTGGGTRIREDGILGDIAPTILELLSIEVPDEMTGRTLLQ